MGEVVNLGKTVKLNVLDRMALLGILPKEGSFQNLKLLRILREELSFNEAENKALQFRVTDNMLKWNNIVLTNKETGECVNAPSDVLQEMLNKNPEAFTVEASCPEKEITVGPTIEEVIVKALTDLDKKGKLTEDHYSLYEKFMEGRE